MSFEYYDQLPVDAKAQYEVKLEACGLTECPYKVPAGRWVNKPTQWPPIQWPDIFYYLIDTPGVYTRESMKNFRSLEAHNFFTSGWVQTVYHMSTPLRVKVLKADVRPSWRVTEQPHHPWVAIKDDGSVVAGHCDCMAGLGESCSHIAAVLFKVEAAVRLGHTSVACTDEPCKWNDCFVKKVKGAKIQDIKFYSTAAKEKLLNSKRKIKRPIPPSTADDQQQFLAGLQQVTTKPIALSTFEATCEPFHETSVMQRVRLPRAIPEIATTLTENHSVEDFREKLAISQDQYEFVARVTESQSASSQWKRLRVGRITASQTHAVLHTDPERPSKSLVKRICTKAQNINVESIKWGKDHEKSALKEYRNTLESEKVHENLSIYTTGLHICTNTPWIAASPDGLVECSCCDGKGVIEIKCPFSLRHVESVEDLVKLAPFISEDFILDPRHEYFTQVQMEMYCCGRQYADFIIWTPQSLIIVRVARDESFITKAVEKLSLFWDKHISSFLLTRSLDQGEDVQQTGTSADAEPRYCICQEDKDDTMIGCDNPQCTLKWYHLSCLKRKRVPKGDWVCKDCKKKGYKVE